IADLPVAVDLTEDAVILEVDLSGTGAQIWEHLTDPELLATWSPIVPERPLTEPGPVLSRETPEAEPVAVDVLATAGDHALTHRWGDELREWLIDEARLTLLMRLPTRSRHPPTSPDGRCAWACSMHGWTARTRRGSWAGRRSSTAGRRCGTATPRSSTCPPSPRAEHGRDGRRAQRGSTCSATSPRSPTPTGSARRSAPLHRRRAEDEVHAPRADLARPGRKARADRRRGHTMAASTRTSITGRSRPPRGSPRRRRSRCTRTPALRPREAQSPTAR